MKSLFCVWRLPALVLCLALAACGGGNDDDPPPGTIGPGGGTVSDASGARVQVPAGALTQELVLAVTQSSAGAPALPAGVSGVGPMFALTPHGTTFATPATLTLPFNGAAAPSGTRLALYKTGPGETQWERVPGATFEGNTATAPISSFSHAQVVTEPLFRGDPVREWTFSSFQGHRMKVVELDRGRQEAGVIDKLIDFGEADYDRATPLDHEISLQDGSIRPADGIANGLAFSSANGVTYGAGAEAPFGNPNLATDPAGGRTQLLQYQAYIKRAPDARLKFTISRAEVEVRDDNGGFFSPSSFSRFPGTCVYPLGTTGAHDACQDRLRGEVAISVTAFTHATSATTPGRRFFGIGGTMEIAGHTMSWLPQVHTAIRFGQPLWNMESFERSLGNRGNFMTMRLKEPITVEVDLSSLPVGQEFTLRSQVLAEATNRQGDKFAGLREGPTAASAFLRDPLGIGGGSVEHSGLEPIASPVLVEPEEAPVSPVACPTPGGDPRAGAIGFSAPAYRLETHGSAQQPVLITRTGGTRGAVTATFSTGSGTAVAGADYQATTASVFFADGDDVPRLARIVLVPDDIDGEPDKTLELRLADPGNCATLGEHRTATVTLVDDKAPPPPPATGLDPAFGVAGLAAMPETGQPLRGFGGDRSAMAQQADGKIVMVGGTFTDFILARFNADGSLDTGFGIGGKVTTDMGGGPFEQEEALAVAIQPDGKIVVVGHTSIPTSPPAPDQPPTFALARYLSDGSLDQGFGNGGRVSANVNGIARAVAIQPDGRIVVAGEFSFEAGNGSDSSDFTVARFNENGNLDLGFGSSGTGQLTIDIGSASNSARNIVLLPDGRIVVSGKPPGDQPGSNHTDLLRLTAGGVPDASFGNGGKLVLAGIDVGQGLVRQPDGKLVLAGTATPAPGTARFLLQRLNPNGTPDTGFGNAGTVDTGFAQNAAAAGLALQADGRIVAVGTTAFSANANFVVARYGVDGAIDTGFGVNGVQTLDFFSSADIGENVLVQPDGKILVSGQARRNFDGYGLARLNP